MRRFLLLLLPCLVPVTAQAETFRLERQPDAFFLETLGPLQYRFDLTERSNVDLLVDLDWQAETMRYESFDLTFAGCSIVEELEMTNGPNETETIVVELEFDPFTLTVGPSAIIPLVPMTGGNFHIADMWDLRFEESLEMSGDYQLTGPTENAGGEFAISFWVTPHGGKYHQVSTNGYPETVRLIGEAGGVWWPSDGTTLFNAAVDGHQVKLGVREAVYRLESPSLTLVPEPRTSALLLGVLLFLAWRWKRPR